MASGRRREWLHVTDAGASKLEIQPALQSTAALPATQIRCVAAYLQNGYAEIEKQPTAADLQGLAAEMAAEIQEMESLCRDPERNIPLGNESFPLMENLGYCRNRQFRELCDRVDGV